MTDLIDRIGPYLGIAAFLGLAILAFLIIQQAREVRRLREWAGRAPERATEAGEAEAAVAEARGEAVEPDEVEEAPPSALGGWFSDRRAQLGDWFAELDRRLPVDPRYLGAVLVAVVIAAAVLTSGFGLLGGDDTGGGGGGDKKAGDGKSKPEKVEVAVLNATQEVGADGTEIAGVQGLAGTVATDAVEPLKGFKIGEKADAPDGFERTTIMYEPDFQDAADELATGVSDQLGEPQVEPMVSDVRNLIDGAPLALVVGRDDADFGAQGQ
jgi:LytR cell envelope-related transcriptional attenuator